VPVEGFSRQLRLEPDVERFWFLQTIVGARLPVHVVFSRSSKIAEVKAADLKVVRLSGVESVSEARRLWVDRLEASRKSWRSSASNRSSQSKATPGPGF